MIDLTLAEIAAAVGGRLHRADGSERVTGSVEFDSRRVTAGGLFVALRGERADGHDFAATAIADGAVAVLAAREVDAPAVIVPPLGSGAASGAYVLAADTDGSGAAVLAGLAALARAVVDRLAEPGPARDAAGGATAGPATDGAAAPGGLTVVGITGSSGKTSTKDLVAALLRPLGPTVAPPGSFNNELGHPWTALRADAATRHLVLELSARGPGHVAALCRVAPPRVGVVLNVGAAHLGEFGSRAAIAQAKGELVEALPAAADGGVAVLNADDDAVSAMASRTVARVVLVGEAATADVRATDVEVGADGRAAFTLVTPAGDARVRLATHGRHQVGNALAAAAVALELGASVADVAAGLGTAVAASRWRMEVTERPDGVTVINDAYNANPESVRAALTTLAAMAATDRAAGDRGRADGGTADGGTADGGTRARRTSWAVLGPIGELGEESDAAHREVGALTATLGVDRLVAVGPLAAPIHEARVAGGGAAALVPDVDAAIALLRAEVEPGDVVLVKASRAFGLERVADGLLTDAWLAAEHADHPIGTTAPAHAAAVTDPRDTNGEAGR